MNDEKEELVAGDVEIGGLKYAHSEAFKRVDPIAYRCSFNDWADGEKLDII